MDRASFPGTCRFCNEHLPKVAASRHLSGCSRRPKGDRDVFHVVVEVPRTPYWLHVEVDTEATLADVDDFLRKTWLECCGHLSSFTINGTDYSRNPEIGDEEGMEVAVEDVLKPGMKILHRYDFGSTTELSIRVIAQRKGGSSKTSILLLARNDPPVIVCTQCGAPSTQVCTQCIYDEEAAFCKKCAKKHECGEEMLLPLVNSPRAGVCGYSG